MTTTPPRLRPGDTIGFVAPSSPLQLDRIETGKRYLQSKGYQVKLGKHLKDADRFLAGRDEGRARDMIFCGR